METTYKIKCSIGDLDLGQKQNAIDKAGSVFSEGIIRSCYGLGCEMWVINMLLPEIK